jgi:organic radical activating enzyme
VDELVDEVVASGAGHVVLTGGEPMMFPSLDRLASTADLEKGSCIAARSCTLCLGRIELVTGNLAPSLVLSDSDVKALLYLLNHPIVVP